MLCVTAVQDAKLLRSIAKVVDEWMRNRVSEGLGPALLNCTEGALL